MSITINSNILSLNAQRRLGQHTSNLRSSFEKLSSGLRVSKASDDAAGLSISENLKTDARLSSQALRNVNDGISMISIISGALDSQKSILFRMAELAEQSANGVNSQTQRVALQKEYMSLQEEFDRVASSAKFNGISLLRNPDPNTISIMAGITGASRSLPSVTTANSHRFAGEYQMQSDLNNDSYVNLLDLSIYGPLISQTPWSSGTSNSSQHPATRGGEFFITGNQGSQIRILIAAQQLNGVPNLKLRWSAVKESNYSDYANNSPLTDDISNTAKTLSGAGTLGTSGETFSFSLDISDITFSDNFEDPQHVAFVTSSSEARPSNIGFTNITYQREAKRALVTVRRRF